MRFIYWAQVAAHFALSAWDTGLIASLVGFLPATCRRSGRRCILKGLLIRRASYCARNKRCRRPMLIELVLVRHGWWLSPRRIVHSPARNGYVAECQDF